MRAVRGAGADSRSEAGSSSDLIFVYEGSCEVRGSGSSGLGQNSAFDHDGNPERPERPFSMRPADLCRLLTESLLGPGRSGPGPGPGPGPR